jgi:bacillolysin
MNHGRIRQLFLVATAALLVFSGDVGAAPAKSTKGSGDQTLIQGLVSQGARVSRSPHSGQVVFIGTDHGKGLALPGMAQGLAPGSNAMAALDKYSSLFGIKDPASELKTMKEFSTADGRSMVRYQQLYKRLPVIGGELIVNMDASGRMSSMNGEAKSGINLDPTPTLTATQAEQKAIETVAAFYKIGASQLAATAPVLSIYAPELIGPGGPGPQLVWRMEVVSGLQQKIDEFVLVNAKKGGIALHFTKVEHAKNRKTYDGSAVAVPSDLPGTLLCNESSGDACTSGADLDADTAHQYAGDTYDFYYNNFGRDSINDKGMTIVSTVHMPAFTIGCPNAAWYSPKNQMLYCDGMPEGDDVVGHELTHGVTDRTSELLYWYQSGAINESMSDVFGEFIDLTNGRGASDIPGSLPPSGTRWELGEGSVIGVIRSMWTPNDHGQPNRMSDTTYYAIGSGDNGGVHTNSGVGNHAAALMVDGGNFNSVTVAPLDADGNTSIGKAAQIYYEVETHLLTSGSDYLDLYNALYQGCLNLVGTHGITNADCTDSVQAATNAVEMSTPAPTGATAPDAANFCPTAGQVPSNLFADDFEGSLNKWTKGGSNANSVWSIDAPSSYGLTPYASGGKHSLYADDLYSLNDSYITMNSQVTIPSGGMYLRFDQAFALYSGDGNGGGHLEYSADGGPWTDVSSLFVDGQDYNGTASNFASMGGTAWVGDSHGYVSSRYFVPDTTGTKIKFRWRLYTGSTYYLGWWIDNVRVYQCVANSAPTAPGLVSPADAATGVDSTAPIDFTWNPSTDVDGDNINYNLQVCTDGTFTTCPVNITKSAATSIYTTAAMGGGFGLLFASMLVGGRRRRLGAALAIVAVIGLLASCGGSSSGGGGGSITYSVPGGTLSAGTNYTWRVTADDGNSGTTPSSSWTFDTL